MSFQALLDKPVESCEPPKPLPEGTYRFTIGEPKFYEPKDEDSKGRILFPLTNPQPLDDVSEAELAEFGDTEEVVLFHNQWLHDDRDAFYLRKFLEAAGVEASGRTLLEAATGAAGYEIIGEVTQDPDKENSEIIYNRVRNFGSVAA